MEMIDIILLVVVALFCYWRGLVAGYDTKVAESHKTKLVNIRAEKIGDSFHFRDFESDLFITQSKSMSDGIEYIQKQIGDDKTILIAMVEQDSVTV